MLTVRPGAGAAALAAGSALGCCYCSLSDTLQSAAAAEALPLQQQRVGDAACEADLRRVWVIGHSGVGKTTTARRMAAELGALHVDLDELHWLPGWVERPADEMLALLVEQLATAPGGRWVVSGNYTRFVQSHMRGEITALVYLHLPFWANQQQLLARTATRWLDGGTCCNGNVEELRNIFQLNKGSILYWGWTGYERMTTKLQAIATGVLAEGRLRPSGVLVLRSVADADALVAGIALRKGKD